MHIALLKNTEISITSRIMQCWILSPITHVFPNLYDKTYFE